MLLPPTVMASCTRKVPLVVSTVISAKAPVNAAFCALLPRLYCTCEAILISLYAIYVTIARSVTLRQFVPSAKAGTGPPVSLVTYIIAPAIVALGNVLTV